MPPSPIPKRNESSSDGAISMPQYGSVTGAANVGERHAEQPARTLSKHHHSTLNSFASLKDVASRVAFLDSTKTHHHPPHPHGHRQQEASGDYSTIENSSYDSPLDLQRPSSDSDDDSGAPHSKVFFSHTNLRKLALDLSLWINIFILLTKAIAYLETSSLSILAALVDSVLDVVSQWILAYTESRSSKTRSSAHYPAGASRLEPLGVLSCAALMGFASFGVLKEALENLFEGMHDGSSRVVMDENWSSFWSMLSVVVVKLGLWRFCQHVGNVRITEANANNGKGGSMTPPSPVFYVDSTLEALAQDHWNDCLSNVVAAAALLCTLSNELLWILDPIGAITISLYIIFSWYSTGKEQIEQLTGKAAPRDFIDELYETANNFDPKMEVDVVRAYHFGPKFLVELEVVLPRNTLLFESHDLGMELQYEIESREEVERCFVHIDYESRPYDEHVVSKVPELRERYRPYKQMTSAISI
mmetsp:Transcript_12655/g.30884  ORF Transcript_12655/g.30884 Transcript_12655/m.30884 type:complete len:474 (-) Transcript_12655:333-1754(-)|eukprot:CAMPEP_0181122502 /NCGR_PEP_ID=MMETSP1071-20121207/25352_1 /TAXON_ID=35127 /ORGANISM="Thalassiosira sp., Strain NH16" /LENGTH=473 /DNA_ID=CAMNT_0023207485 /DNA_START=16 /DNA_END=1437 /DNA_ORIENTATION=-